MSLLTEQELRILVLVGEGYHNKQISAELNVSISVIKSCLEDIYQKLGVHNRVQAVVRAIHLEVLKV